MLLLTRGASSRKTWSIARVKSASTCFGMVGSGVLTVRFTYRDKVIRIFGAGYWRKGKAIYERENQVHE